MTRNKYVLAALVLSFTALVIGGLVIESRSGNAQEPYEYWGKRCNKETPSYCEVFQTVSVKESNQKLLEFALGYPKDSKGAQAVLVLPLGFIMTDGIGLQIDDGEMNKAMVRFCNTSGCYVFMNLPDSFVENMETAKGMSVFFLDGTGKKIRIEMPLEGFAAKLKEIKT